MIRRPRLLAAIVMLVAAALAPAAEPKPIKLLFLGDNGHHRPAERFRQLAPVLARRGIDLTYTDRVEALNAKTLGAYDGLVIYANTTAIAPEQETALLDYVASGKGFIPLHCASYCFLNSPKYIELVGAQFQRHGTGTFRTVRAAVEHPILKGYGGFESWDETYVHTKHHEKDRTVLEYRQEGDRREPWTWVRTHGKGRVFYTAWGHDERTWGHPGFQNLVERGIRWAVGGDPAQAGPFRDAPEMTPIRKDVKPFEYVEANVPFYPPGRAWGTTERGPRKMQLPLGPDESIKHLTYPTDFEVKLFASEKNFGGGKPICMTWDERGRLWVALTFDYPNEMQPAGQGRDRIVIVEDTDNDDVADRTTVFADKLSIPTSMAFANGGLVVAQAPDMLFLKDTDGDDKADERRVLFSGWGTRDTHAGPSNLVYGLDNWLYGIVGYSGFDGVVGGQRHRFSQGFFRFKADGSKLEFLRNTNNNSWGVGFSEEGLLFGSTANGCPSVFLAVPNRYYEAVRGWSPGGPLQNIAPDNKFHPVTDKVRQVDWHGGFTAAAGHALYTARLYPRDYWNRTSFVTEGTGHLVATFVLQPDGSNFRARYGWNLLASDDEWTSPSMAEVGPDGCMWVIDWYNFIYQHNPTPPGFKTGKGAAYETDLRDKKHGRVYRLVPREGVRPAPMTLQGATADQLVSTLKHTNMFWRKHAQRLLVERGKHDVVPALVKLAADPSVDEIGLNGGVTHALWALHGLGAAETRAAAAAALKHASAGVRRNAVAVLPRDKDGRASLLRANVVADADAQVRLAALLALSEMPADAEAAAVVTRALRNPDNLNDRWLPDALTAAAAAHDLPFLKAITAERQALPPRALTIVSLIAEHYARGGPSESIGTLVTALASAEPSVAEAALAGLSKGWPRRTTAPLDEGAEKALAQLLTRVSAGAKGQLIRLATTWGSKGFEKQAAEALKALQALVADVKAADADRVGAAKQLVELRPDDPAIVEALLDVVSPRTSPTLTAGLLEALASSQVPALGPSVVRRAAGWTPTARAAALRMLVSRPAGARALLDAIEKGQVQPGELALDQKQVLTTHPDRFIAGRAQKVFARGGALPNPDRQKVIESLHAVTKRTGDAVAGKEVFKKHCATCHMHNGEGNKVGPDLSGVAVHPKEHLLTEIIDPSRSVEGNFRVYTVETKDGRVLSGLLASETRTSVELIDSQAKRLTVLRDDIDSLLASSKSLMPEGFEKQMTEAELVNLLEFLTKRGRYLPLPLNKVATVVSTRGMFYSTEAPEQRLIFRDWGPKTFAGVPFVLVDPEGERVPNVVMLYGPEGSIPPKMPKSVSLPCSGPAKAIHLLSGISGWGYPATPRGTVSMIVRLHYADGKTEDHELKNGEHFSDYIRRVDVPGSQFAFALRSQQLRYLAIQPKRKESLAKIEFVKGSDSSAPVVMAVTLESPE